MAGWHSEPVHFRPRTRFLLALFCLSTGFIGMGLLLWKGGL